MSRFQSSHYLTGQSACVFVCYTCMSRFTLKSLKFTYKAISIYLNYSSLFFIKIILFSLSDQLFDKANHSFTIFTMMDDI